MTTTRRSARPLQKSHLLEDFIDATFQSAVGVGSVIVIGAMGTLAWNGKDTCVEFFSLETVCSMQFAYMGGSFIVLGLIAKGINIYYFPPLKPIADPIPVVKKKKSLILGNDVRTRAIQSTRQHHAEKQAYFWKKKSKAVMNSITAGCSHIFTQCSTLATDSKEKGKAVTKSITTGCSHIFTQFSTLATHSQHWLTQSRSTWSSAPAWEQSRFFSNTNSHSSSSSTSRSKRKKKSHREESSNSVQSTIAILQSISPAASTDAGFHHPASTEENNDFSIFSPASTISTSESNTAPISVNNSLPPTSSIERSEVSLMAHPATEIKASPSPEPIITLHAPLPMPEETAKEENPIPFSSSSTMCTSVASIVPASTSESSSEIISAISPATESGALSSSASSTTPCTSLPTEETVENENLIPFSSPSTTSTPVTDTVSVSVSTSSPATSLVATPSVTKAEVDKEEKKLIVSQQIAIAHDAQLGESGNGWPTSRLLMQEKLRLQQEKKHLKQQIRSSQEASMLLMQENSQLRQQEEVLKRQVHRAEHQANHLAGITTQLSNQLSRLFSIFQYPYYAPFPSALVVHQPLPASDSFLPHSQTHQR